MNANNVKYLELELEIIKKNQDELKKLFQKDVLGTLSWYYTTLLENEIKIKEYTDFINLIKEETPDKVKEIFNHRLIRWAIGRSDIENITQEVRRQIVVQLEYFDFTKKESD